MGQSESRVFRDIPLHLHQLVSVIKNPTDTGRLQPAVAYGVALVICITITTAVSGGHLLTVCMSAVNRQSKTLIAPFCIRLTVTIGILGGCGISRS
ncbi:aquaporin-8-like [Salvelinus alpinus]